MNNVDEDELIYAWHCFFSADLDLDEKKNSEHRWAADCVRRLLPDRFLVPKENLGIMADPERAWAIILRLVETAPSRSALAAVAAGPLRQLLDSYFDEYIARVRTEVIQNVRFAYVLSHIFIHDQLQLQEVLNLGRRAAILSFDGDNLTQETQEVESLVKDWLAFHRVDSNAKYQWAVDEISDVLPRLDPNKLWRVIQQLLIDPTSPEEISLIGSLISELLSTAYSDFIELIEKTVPNNKRLCVAVLSAHVEEEDCGRWEQVTDLARSSLDHLEN